MKFNTARYHLVDYQAWRKAKKEAKLVKTKSSEDLKKESAEYKKKTSHLKFLTDVTTDIINRGVYSERGLRSAINSQVRN